MIKFNNTDVQEYRAPFNSLIGAWYINEKVCDELINFHINSSNKHAGYQTAHNEIFVNKNIKDSMDVVIHPPDFDNIESIKIYLEYLQECLHRYLQKYPLANHVPEFGIRDSINIQHYQPGGGFKAWHFENGNENILKRYLVFMTFLNDVEDGGTEFYYQNLCLPAIKGLTLIWPAYWTHSHKGQISKKHEKYISTGWFEFKV